MAVNVFILGRPGSGKSTAARRIANLVQPEGWSPVRISDYDILHGMFQREKYSLNDEPKNFRPTQHNGFDVINFSVLDTALIEVQRKALKHIEEYASHAQKLILIEFARDDYGKALHLFNPAFLRDAYFLFLKADIDTCIKRVHERIAHPITVDDHFVSDEIIRCYYYEESKPYMTFSPMVDYHVNEMRVTIIDNMGTRESFNDQLARFVDLILKQKPNAQRETSPLQNTPDLSPVPATPIYAGMSKVEEVK